MSTESYSVLQQLGVISLASAEGDARKKREDRASAYNALILRASKNGNLVLRWVAANDQGRELVVVLILGLNAYHPDSAACMLQDGRFIAAAEEERFRRIKHW